MLDSPLFEGVLAAHQALLRLVPEERKGRWKTEENDLLPRLIGDLVGLVDEVQNTAAARIGPPFAWVGPPAGSDPDPWGRVIRQLDLDDSGCDDPEGASDIGEWDESALARAALVYRRECRWDFAPGEAGIWLIAVQPYANWGSSTHSSWSGVLAGFVILYDRDGDGEYETLGHMWTAREWRRRGIASDLVRTAQERFAVRRLDGVTEGGASFFESVAPELLES